MPNREPSSSRPIALVKSPLPSASIRMSVPTPWFSPQAFITNTSLTETQAMVSTPLALKSATCCLKLGRCLAEQVGVKAPGSANSATFLPANSSSVVTGLGPPSCISVKVADGILSPTLMVMSELRWGWGLTVFLRRGGVVMPGNEFQRRVRRQWGREEIALAELTVEAGEPFAVTFAFDAFHHHRAFQVMCKRDDGGQHNF